MSVDEEFDIILKKFDLEELRSGAIIGIFGPPGSGKTVLATILGKYLPGKTIIYKENTKGLRSIVSEHKKAERTGNKKESVLIFDNGNDINEATGCGTAIWTKVGLSCIYTNETYSEIRPIIRSNTDYVVIFPNLEDDNRVYGNCLPWMSNYNEFKNILPKEEHECIIIDRKDYKNCLPVYKLS